MKLAKWLVEQIVNEDTNIKKIVAIYPGRFQPMGAHHAKAYKWLNSKFSDTYVATSGKVALPKSPFGFSEKKKIINSHGISKVVQVRNPYQSTEILKKYDPETTAVVFMVGEKDQQRLGGKFFRPWKGKAEVGYKEGAYTIIAPHVSMNVPGYREMSGTSLRAVLGDKTLEKKDKQKIYKGIFGHLKNYDWVVKKLEKLNESNIEEFIIKTDFKKLLSEASVTGGSKGNEVDDGPSHGFGSIRAYRKTQKKIAERMGYLVVRYLLDASDGDEIRGSDEHPTPEKHRRDVTYPKGPVTSVSYFPSGDQGILTPQNQTDKKGRSAYNAWKKHITKIASQVGMQLINWIDSEIAIDTSKKEPNKPDPRITKIVNKTAKLNKQQNLSESLLLEGGAYGHMAHPFDDKGLTFGDLKNIIDMGLQGQLDREEVATEKTDGQNLFVTWNKKLLAARNAGDIKRGGVDAKSIASKFAGRGNIEKAFNYAMRDLSKAIGSLSKDQKQKIFNNGNNWVNMEIMYPASSNVINYDAPRLQFHNVLQYKDGRPIGSISGGARILAGMIAQVNQNVQKTYSVIGPKILKVKRNQDFAVKKPYFIGKLNKLMSKLGMNDGNSFAQYHQAWWEQYVDKKFGPIENRIKMGLVKRWAFSDKSFRLNKKTIEDEKVLAKAIEIDKQKHQAQVKKNMLPFENLFFELGAEVLKNAEGFLAANPDKAVQGIRKQLASAISSIRKGGDIKKLNRLSQQLNKIKSIGGFKTIVPSEGLVFIYKGKTYKLTGAFAPINQITGMIYF